MPQRFMPFVAGVVGATTGAMGVAGVEGVAGVDGVAGVEGAAAVELAHALLRYPASVRDIQLNVGKQHTTAPADDVQHQRLRAK